MSSAMKNSDKDQVVAYIGLGSNLENPAEQINSAHAAIAGLNDVEELAFSSLYHSPPMGPQDQPEKKGKKERSQYCKKKKLEK
jgi:2-amino-4-hydroxy-6-hydroxymethyldihydropteridine diphosphokinase